jgi:hypothetical protein
MRVVTVVWALAWGCTGDDPAETDTDAAVDTDDSDLDSDVDSDVDTDVAVTPVLLHAVEVPVDVEAGSDSIDADTSWALRAPTVGTVTSVDLYLRGPGASGDPLTVTLGAGSAPPGTLAGTATLAASALSDTALGWATVTFDPPVQIDGELWIALSVPSTSASNYGASAWDTGDADQLALKDGADAWALYAKTYDWPHRVYGTP